MATRKARKTGKAGSRRNVAKAAKKAAPRKPAARKISPAPKRKAPAPRKTAPPAGASGTLPRLTGEQILALDKRYILRPWASIAEPVPLVRGRGIYVWDAEGRRYMDFAAGYFVNAAGHCHPKVIAAAKAQLDAVTQVTMRNVTPAAALLAEKLITLAPGGMGKLLYTTGGAEANEMGLKMVRCRSGRPDVLALENAFHGLTMGTLAACSSEPYRKTLCHPIAPTIHFAPTPYCYRCPEGDPATCDLACARKMEDVIRSCAAAGTPIGSFLVEPVQSVGGIIPPERWWREVEAILARHGILLFADEIQSGLGRTGAMFACNHWNLKPHVVTVAKGISGGVGSLGAAMARDDVVEKFQGGTVPTSSGNAVSCASGYAMLNVLDEEKIVENSAAMGRRLTEKIRDLDNPFVGDVRFQGLMGGIELVMDRATKAVFPKAAMSKMKEEMLRRDVIITTSGPLGNVVRTQPPLVIDADQVDEFVAKLDDAIRVCAKP